MFPLQRDAFSHRSGVLSRFADQLFLGNVAFVFPSAAVFPLQPDVFRMGLSGEPFWRPIVFDFCWSYLSSHRDIPFAARCVSHRSVVLSRFADQLFLGNDLLFVFPPRVSRCSRVRFARSCVRPYQSIVFRNSAKDGG